MTAGSASCWRISHPSAFSVTTDIKVFFQQERRRGVPLDSSEFVSCSDDCSSSLLSSEELSRTVSEVSEDSTAH